MANPAPLYIQYGALDIWTAAAGTAAPQYVTTSPSGSWTKIGTNGSLEYSDTGLKISRTQALDVWRGQRSGPFAIARTEEDVMIEFELADQTITWLARALGGISVSDTNPSGGVPGINYINEYRGPGRLTPVALLLRMSESPEMSAGVTQGYYPYACEVGDVEQTFSKTGARLIPFKYQVLENPSGGATRMGIWTQQTDAAA